MNQEGYVLEKEMQLRTAFIPNCGIVRILRAARTIRTSEKSSRSSARKKGD